MSFTPTAAGQALKDQALTKLLVYYRDGNSRTYYGRHEGRGYQAADPRELAIRRQQKYVASVHALVRVAIIYDQTNGQEIARFKNGAWI